MPGAAMSTSDEICSSRCGSKHRDRASFAVSGDRDVPGIDVLPLRQPLHGRRSGRRHNPGASRARCARRFVRRRACRTAARRTPARQGAPASCAKIGMPATTSSRSTDPEPATRTTAGCRSRPCPCGIVNVPARLKPGAGMMTSVSFGLRTGCDRIATPASSDRTTARSAPGMSSRTSRARSSIVTLRRAALPGSGRRSS